MEQTNASDLSAGDDSSSRDLLRDDPCFAVASACVARQLCMLLLIQIRTTASLMVGRISTTFHTLRPARSLSCARLSGECTRGYYSRRMDSHQVIMGHLPQSPRSSTTAVYLSSLCIVILSVLTIGKYISLDWNSPLSFIADHIF